MQKSTGRDRITGRFLPKNKAAISKGTEVFLRTGKIPSQIRGGAKIKAELKRIRGDLERLLGRERVSIKTELILDQLVAAVGYCKLFELFIKKAGLLDPVAARKKQISFQPGFRTYLELWTKQTNALAALDLSTPPPVITTPLELAKSIDADKAKDSEG